MLILLALAFLAGCIFESVRKAHQLAEKNQADWQKIRDDLHAHQLKQAATDTKLALLDFGQLLKARADITPPAAPAPLAAPAIPTPPAT